MRVDCFPKYYSFQTIRRLFADADADSKKVTELC